MPNKALFATPHEELKKLVCNFLTSMHTACVSVENQKKAQHWLANNSASLIIIDQDILVENPAAWLNDIQRQCPQLRAILLANTADVSVSEAWINAGMGMVVNKPIDPFDLLKCIQNCTESPTSNSPRRSIHPQGLQVQLKTYQTDYTRALAEFASRGPKA